MHLEHLGLSREPFAEPPDSDIFFQEGGRANLLRSAYADLQRGCPVVRIIGAEGSGKTTLSLLLTRLLPAEFQAIYLASPGGSFDELVQAIGAEFGLDGEEDVLAALRVQQRQAGKKVLLIIDEAEKMFPAALERLFRAAFAAEGLQVILAGRPALNDHLAQLTAHCPDMDIQAGHLVAPLSEAETEDYLAFRLTAVGMTAADSRAVFSGGAVRRLFEQAGGNLRLLHSLTDHALRQAGQDLPVLAAHVSASSNQSGAKKRKKPLISLGRVLKASLAGAALILLAALLVLHEKDARREEPPVRNIPPAETKQEPPLAAKPTAAAPEKVHVKPVELFPTAKPEDIPPEIESQLSEEAAAEPEQPITTAEPSVAQPSEETVPAPSAAEPEQPLPEQESDALVAEPLYTPPAETRKPEQPLAEPPPAEVQAKKIIQLAPGGRKTKPLPEKKTEQQPQQPAAAPDAQRLYQELLIAGSRLKSRPHAGRYTIQLLTLSSPDAAAQLKEMIVRDEYVEHKDQLQILRKTTSPAELLVFYGSYGSMEEAAAALDNMPLFLRKHHPYVLPVDGAVAKAD